MTDVIEERFFRTAQGRAARVRIELDGAAGDCDPRANDTNGSIMLTFESQYISPDRMRDLPGEMESVVQEYCSAHMSGLDVRMIQRFASIFLPQVLFVGALCRNGYDGALTLDESPNNGQSAVGIVVVTKDSIAQIDPDADAEAARTLAEFEVSRYSSWAVGDVYGYVAEVAAFAGGNPDYDSEVYDSCWGYIGKSEWGHMMQQGIDALPDAEEIEEWEYEELTRGDDGDSE